MVPRVVVKEGEENCFRSLNFDEKGRKGDITPLRPSVSGSFLESVPSFLEILP